MIRGTIAYIDKSALNHNLQRIRSQVGDRFIWAVVKANAYGHGALAVTDSLQQADGFAVATLDEALLIRQRQPEKPIMLLEGCIDAEQTKVASQHKLTLVIHSLQQVTELESLKQVGHSHCIWLKIDTGMHRLGIAPKQVDEVLTRLNRLGWVEQVGVMSHFSCADQPEHVENTRQKHLLLQSMSSKVLASKSVVVSMANSAAIFSQADSLFDAVRPGIALYGATALADRSAKDLGLKAVMTLTAPIIALRKIEQGEGCGYGLNWQAQQDSMIATVAIGYGDGYPRNMQTGAPVIVNGQRVPLVGRVSMDLITIDVTGIEVSIGDNVELWGKQLPVDEVAAFCDSIGYELLTRLSARVSYQYLD